MIWGRPDLEMAAALPADMVNLVASHLSHSGKGVMRLVCKDWANAIAEDTGLALCVSSFLTPAGRRILPRFAPRLEELIVACRHVRTLRLKGFPRLASLSLQRCDLGDGAQLAQAAGLRRLYLTSCSGVELDLSGLSSLCTLQVVNGDEALGDLNTTLSLLPPKVRERERLQRPSQPADCCDQSSCCCCCWCCRSAARS